MKNKLMIGAGLIAGMLLLSGCGKNPLTPNERNIMKGKSISLVPLDTSTHPRNSNLHNGPFMDVNLIANAIQSASEKMGSHPRYMYPTGILGNKAINSLTKRYAMVKKPMNQKADYSLEINTIWSYKRKGLGFMNSETSVNMQNDISLKNNQTGKVISQVFCFYNDIVDKNIPGYDEKAVKDLSTGIANKEAKKAINLCMKKFNQEML